MKSIYVILWQTSGYTGTSVFTSRKSADYYFDKLSAKFNLTEDEHPWFLRQAYGHGKAKTKTGDGTLVLIKEIPNFCSI